MTYSDSCKLAIVKLTIQYQDSCVFHQSRIFPALAFSVLRLAAAATSYYLNENTNGLLRQYSSRNTDSKKSYTDNRGKKVRKMAFGREPTPLETLSYRQAHYCQKGKTLNLLAEIILTRCRLSEVNASASIGIGIMLL
jgi:hypothetical protein